MTAMYRNEWYTQPTLLLPAVGKAVAEMVSWTAYLNEAFNGTYNSIVASMLFEPSIPTMMAILERDKRLWLFGVQSTHVIEFLD
jgi:hypothetical protein